MKKLSLPRANEAVSGFVDGGAKMALSSILSEVDIEQYVQVNHPSFYRRVLMEGTMGLGDSYIEGVWDSPQIDEFVFQILSSGVYQQAAPLYNIIGEFRRRLMNLQSLDRSNQVIEAHYDLPPEFYEAFLGPMRKYTCLDFTDTDDIEVAERQSMHKVCEKLELKPGETVMDIGGGWGGPAHFMAEEYGVSPTIVTLSKEQAAYIRERYGDQIRVLECDYREIPHGLRGSFDAISNIGVLEHVGHKNYADFFRIAHQSLRRGGRILTHTLYTPYDSVASNPWVDKHIFRNGEISPRHMIEGDINAYFEPNRDSSHPTFEDISPHYPPTLHAWKDGLTKAKEEGRVDITKEEFRKFVFYFMLYAGAISAGHVRVGQFLYRKAA
ncbi:MAG: class I SAM-dependent methyltransferase [Patescibacteria group bacterium]|nr:class I SAM-dependent methyltransferase [Patescibacteria group bacterium]